MNAKTTFEEINAQGLKEFPNLWLVANSRAIEIATALRISPWDKKIKRAMVSAVLGALRAAHTLDDLTIRQATQTLTTTL